MIAVAIFIGLPLVFVAAVWLTTPATTDADDRPRSPTTRKPR